MLSTLMKFIPMVEKIIPRRSSIPVLQNVCIRDGKILATDLEMTIIMPIKDDRSMLLPFRIVKTVLKSRPKSVVVDVIGDNKIRIDYDQKSVIFPSVDIDDYPDLSMGPFTNVGTWTTSVVRQLYELVPFCSSDELRPSLCGIYINQNGSLRSCATDGHVLRMVCDEKYKSSNSFEGIIPKRVIQLLPRFVKKEVLVSESTEHLCFSIDGNVNVITNKINNVYPNIERVIPTEFSGHVEVDPGQLSTIVKSALDFADKEQRKSVIELKGDVLSMMVHNDDMETMWQSQIKLGSHANQRLKLGLDLAYLDKVLNGFRDDKLLWKYNDDVSASVFTNDGPDMSLIMPIRLTREDSDE